MSLSIEQYESFTDHSDPHECTHSGSVHSVHQLLVPGYHTDVDRLLPSVHLYLLSGMG